MRKNKHIANKYDEQIQILGKVFEIQNQLSIIELHGMLRIMRNKLI